VFLLVVTVAGECIGQVSGRGIESTDRRRSPESVEMDVACISVYSSALHRPPDRRRSSCFDIEAVLDLDVDEQSIDTLPVCVFD